MRTPSRSFSVTRSAVIQRISNPTCSIGALYGNIVCFISGFRGHCLFWAVDDPEHFPEWVYPLRGQDMIDAIQHRIETAMTHFQVSDKP